MTKKLQRRKVKETSLATEEAASFKELIERKLGKNTAEALDLMVDVMRGDICLKKKARNPAPTEDASSYALVPMVEVYPSISERVDVAKFLIEHTVGKVSANVNVGVGLVTPEVEVDFSKLSTEELEKFLELNEKASKGASKKEDIVEGEIVDG